MSAAIYARLSMDRTGLGLAVEEQVRQCREKAAELGLSVGQVYVDNDISATTGKRRPAFEQMLADEPETVIVWHQDRLLRVSRDLERVLEAGFLVHQVTAGSLDLATPTGRAVARTITAWSTFEGEHKAERQRMANQRRAAAGQSFWSHRPFGYERDLSLRENEAAHLRQAYADLLTGKSSYAIANQWTAAGIAMPESPNPWQGRRITDLLKQPRNAGLATYKGKVVGQGRWEPIIDQGTFYAALAILSDPKRRVGGAPRYSLLSGVLRCGRCRSPMARWKGTRPSGTTFDRYRCSGCQFIVDAPWAEQKVTEQALSVYSRVRVGKYSAPVDHSGQIAALTERLTDLAAAYAADSVTLDQLTTGTAAIQQRIDALRQESASEVLLAVHTATQEDGQRWWAGLSTDQRRDWLNRTWVIWAVKDEDKSKRLVFTDIATFGAPLRVGRDKPGSDASAD